ncbi:hypothetical protein ACU686_26750 [Yinghuangia aomiensis]
MRRIQSLAWTLVVFSAAMNAIHAHVWAGRPRALRHPGAGREADRAAGAGQALRRCGGRGAGRPTRPGAAGRRAVAAPLGGAVRVAGPGRRRHQPGDGPRGPRQARRGPGHRTGPRASDIRGRESRDGAAGRQGQEGGRAPRWTG